MGDKLYAEAPCSDGAKKHLHLLKTLCQMCPAVTQQLWPRCTAEYGRTAPLLPPAAAGAPAAASPLPLPRRE